MERGGVDVGVALREGHTKNTPKKVFKSLKRAYTTSITCIETHIQITQYQSTISKKLALKVTSEDLNELRRICEDLIYIIQVPHNRGIYTTSLRLLLSIATSPDPIAFILLERHTNPVLRDTLRTSTELPSEKSIALLHVLDHLQIRHQISLSRHIITHVAAKVQPEASDLIRVEDECKRLVGLAEANPEEIWVNLMVQDLLASVAKSPSMSLTLLERDIYPRVVKITSRARKILLFDRLSRPLVNLTAQSSQEFVQLRKTAIQLLGKPFIGFEETALARETYTALLRFVSNGREQEKSLSIAILESIARSNSPLAWLLTEPEFYEIIENNWALGRAPIDTLYRLLQKSLANRLSAAEATIASIIAGHDVSDDNADQLVHIFQDLIEICKAHHIYDEETVDKAANILIKATAAPETISLLLLDASLIDQYPQILDGATNSIQAKRLVKVIPKLQDRKQLRDAETLVSRLKHTRTWSGLDSDNIRPLCQTLVSSALNPDLHSLQDVAVTALVELTRSPPDCAIVLLEPEFAAGIDSITSQPHGSAPALQLAIAMSSLQMQGQLRADIPRLYKLSNKRSFESQEERVAFDKSVHHLVQLYLEHNEDESTSQLLITSLLVLATGFEPSKEALERGRGTQLITRQGLHRAGFEEALYEVMRQMELSADRLLRQSELAERDQGRYRIIVHRLIQLTRLDLDDWSTSRSIELLGALAKGPETATASLLTILEISGGLINLARNRRLARPIGRILELLDVREAAQVP